MKGLALVLLLLATPCQGAQLRVEVRLDPSTNPVVGETVQLQVDVLTDTWFTSAPQIPVLEIANAIVSAPSSEARHLNLKRDGTTFFGLEYSYRITPTAPGDFVIAPITLSATPGQADSPITLQSVPLHFTVEQPAGVPAGQPVLVARELKLSQTISQSRDSLGIGDSFIRQVTQTADGAQMMLMPAPDFADIDGLKRYVEPPQLKALGDGRGTVSGGERLDRASYVVQRGGEFQLPPIAVQWWDSGARQLRTGEVPGVTFKAAATAFKTPFSVREDVQRLGQHGRLSLSRHWLIFSLWAIALAALLYVSWPWWPRAWRWLKRHGRYLIDNNDLRPLNPRTTETERTP